MIRRIIKFLDDIVLYLLLFFSILISIFGVLVMLSFLIQMNPVEATVVNILNKNNEKDVDDKNILLEYEVENKTYRNYYQEKLNDIKKGEKINIITTNNGNVVSSDIINFMLFSSFFSLLSTSYITILIIPHGRKGQINGKMD